MALRSSILLALAAAALLATLGTILARWRVRRRWSLEEPQRLIEPLPTQPRLCGVILVVCVLVGAGGLFVPGGLLAPPAVVLAALTAFILDHRRGRGWFGVLALVLLGESIVTAAYAWWPGGTAGVALGLALVGLWYVWLAAFWHQQLLDGRSWTTTGRLIPATRWLGYLAVCGGLAVAIVHAITLGGNNRSLAIMGVAGAATALVLVRRSRRWQNT